MKFAPSNAFRCSTTGKTAISWFVAISGRTLGAEREQTPLGNHQVRQAEQRHQLRRVLDQSAVTGLLQAEAILDDVEGMLDLGANTGLDRFELVAQQVDFLAHIQRAPFARAHGDVPANLTFGFRPFLGALIPGVAEALFLMTMKERLRLCDVIDVGRCADHRMYQPGVGIDADVRLHAEVPLIALLGLMHLGVTLALRVLGRGRGRDDRGINDGAFAQHSFQTNWRSPATFALRVERCQPRKQLGPRRDSFQFRQKALTPRRLALRGVLQVSKSPLYLSSPSVSRCTNSRMASCRTSLSAGINQRVLRV